MHTPFCALVGIDVPIVQAPLGPWNTVELAAAVSNAGGLGGLATNLRGAETVRDEMRRMRTSTDRPFAVNHTLRPSLGAQGADIGTRFLAAVESGTPEAFRQAIVRARSEEA